MSSQGRYSRTANKHQKNVKTNREILLVSVMTFQQVDLQQ